MNLTFQNCEEGNFPLQPHNRSIKVYVKNNHKYVNIKRSQFPLNLGYSFTLYKVQSSTINKGILDLKKSYLFTYDDSAAYVYLSRLRKLTDFCVLRDFDNSVFEGTVDSDLILEEKRLLNLESISKF